LRQEQKPMQPHSASSKGVAKHTTEPKKLKARKRDR